MQERKEIKEMFEKKYKLLAREHALRCAIYFLDVVLKKHALINIENMKLSDLTRIIVDIAKDFECYLRGEDFIKENLEFTSADVLYKGDVDGEKKKK